MKYVRTGLSLSLTLTLTAMTLAAPAFGQDGPGRQGVVSFSQGIEFEDYSGAGDSLKSRTAASLALTSETRTQRLEFSLGTELLGEITGDSGDDFDFVNSSAELRYFREGANSSLSFSGVYHHANLGDDVIDTGTEFIIDTGIRESTNLNLDFRTGIEAPFGVDLGAGYEDVNYFATSDPELLDRETVRLDAIARFRITPSLAFRGLAGIEEIEEEGGTDTKNTYVGIGAEGEAAGGLSFSGDILFDRTEVTTLPGPVTVTDDGIGIDLGVNQDLANGSIGLDAASRVDDDGRRTSAEVNRVFEFPDGALALSLGVVDQEGDNSLRFIGGVDYSKETPRGDLTASLSQDTSVDGGLTVVSTGLSVAYSEEINTISGWEATVGYFTNNEVGGPDDETRASATLAYHRDLTADWGMRAGIAHERIDESGGGNSTTNTVFFNIERDITFGF